MMKSSYQKEDVILLLKDITGLVEPMSTKERETFIQAGRHYSEMLPIEYVPTEQYMQVYREALRLYAKPTALAIGNLADKIIAQKGQKVVLVSFARAGLPIGILLKRYIQKKYQINVMHYGISIIRGRGIDKNAMKFLLQKYQPNQLLFVDGWIGKGAIFRELQKDISIFEGVSAEIAVVADPANITELCGTHEDILIPNSCLNSIVSGLISRTFLREDIIGTEDFHGAAFYEELKEADLSYDFIEKIEAEFEFCDRCEKFAGDKFADTYQKFPTGMDEVLHIAEQFGISDINLVKPGIGETTRVLLRRVPWKILLDERYRDEQSLAHIIRLAAEKNVPVEYYPLIHYKACGIIQKLADA